MLNVLHHWMSARIVLFQIDIFFTFKQIYTLYRPTYKKKYRLTFRIPNCLCSLIRILSKRSSSVNKNYNCILIRQQKRSDQAPHLVKPCSVLMSLIYDELCFSLIRHVFGKIIFHLYQRLSVGLSSIKRISSCLFASYLAVSRSPSLPTFRTYQ